MNTATRGNSVVSGMNRAVNTAVNTFTNVANNVVRNTTNAANAAVNAVANVATNTTNAANAAVSAVANVATNAVNKVVNTAAPVVNTILPSSPAANNASKNNTTTLSPLANLATNVSRNNSSSAFSYWPYFLVVILVAGLATVFSLFSSEIRQGYEVLATSIKDALGISRYPVQSEIVPVQEVPITKAPEPPQAVLPDEAAQQQGIVEKILPTGGANEVFNISQNKFTYYDAEPLCRALGAELATYEQVKQAWSRGADWCNYGWVKGQMAVYPTQTDTYEKLQSGPPEQRAACGTVGINGGYFDNPDMRYGVNCFGKKPPQSAHDQESLMRDGKVPPTPESLSVDRLANEFKAQKDSLFIRPFNDAKWSLS